MLLSEDDVKLLNGFLKPEFENPSYELLYRGTRDGFDIAKFKSILLNRSNTVHIYRSRLNKVFGAYVSIQLKRFDSYLKADDAAFIFSITNQSKHKTINEEFSIHLDSDQLISFGERKLHREYTHDLSICGNCDKICQSFSDFGISYELP